MIDKSQKSQQSVGQQNRIARTDFGITSSDEFLHSDVKIIFYFTARPVICGDQCHCYYSVAVDYNVYNCTSTESRLLPNDNNITTIADYFDFSNNKFTEFCNQRKYMKTTSVLDLSSNFVNRICEDTIKFLQNGKMTTLNLADNKLTTLPKTISKITSLQVVRLSGNNFTCNCRMIWMIDWFKERNTTGQRIVEDYDQIFCANGMKKGTKIYQLKAEEMGCFKSGLDTVGKLTIGIFGTLIVLIVIFIIAVGRRWNEVKWLLYLHFNILDKSDRNENLDGKKYDAFISYR